MRKHYVALLVIAVILAVLSFVLPISEQRTLVFIALFVLTLIGQVIFLGYTGQILLCQATFMAIGGYGTAIITVKYGVPSIVGILFGVVLGIIFAYIIGMIILRLRTFYLAIATLAIALITDALLKGWISLTGGYSGITGIPPIAIGGLVFENVNLFYGLAWIIAFIGWLFALHLGRSRFGRALKTIKGNEMVASSVGINVTKYKVTALMITGAYAALSGALMVHFMGLALPGFFSIEESFLIIMAAILGGASSVYGVFLAAPVLEYLPDLFLKLGDYKLIIYGLLFVLVPMYFMDGLVGLVTRLARRVHKIRLKNYPSGKTIAG